MTCSSFHINVYLSLVGETEEGISPSVHQAFASMIGEGVEEEEDEDDDDDEEEDDDDDDDDDYDDEDYDFNKDKEDTEDEEEDDETENDGITAGDVFALEMELNRENKKMMKVRQLWDLFLYSPFASCLLLYSLTFLKLP